MIQVSEEMIILLMGRTSALMSILVLDSTVAVQYSACTIDYDKIRRGLSHSENHHILGFSLQ